MTIQEDLQAIRDRLLSLIEGMSDEELNFRQDETSWSIAQVLEHVSIVEKGVVKAIPLGLKQTPNYTQRDLPLGKWVPNRTQKVMAVESLHPTNQPKTLEEVIILIQNARQDFLEVLDDIDDLSLLEKTSPPVPHPVFGDLSTAQWLRMVPYHESRHIGQIEEIKQAYAQQTSV